MGGGWEEEKVVWDDEDGSEGPGFVDGVRLYPGPVPGTMISTLGSQDEVYPPHPSVHTCLIDLCDWWVVTRNLSLM